jgi:hypothetical protein
VKPDDADARALRREILEDMASIFRDDLAADAWGRLLVEVVRARNGAPLVAGIDVEEVVGDESRVDQVFGGEAARAAVAVLSKAVEALCALDDVLLEDVRGGTFVRKIDGGFSWLAGLVHAPSVRLDRERDDLLAALRSKNEDLRLRFGLPDGGRLSVDLPGESLELSTESGRRVRARATLLATFAPPSRTWGWGGTNPHAPEAVRRASAHVVDEVLDRDMWELSTPVFATDESTAWALAAFVCDRARADGVVCTREGEGLVFLLVRDVRDEEAATASDEPSPPPKGSGV